MERLWTPWRFAYVTATGDLSAPCLFCQAADPATASQHDELVLLRTPLAYVILNRYPYNNGHVMVAPVRHIASLGAATDAELAALMHLTRDVELALTDAYSPHGINVGIVLPEELSHTKTRLQPLLVKLQSRHR
jgi:ATP adenylyltransferase